MNEELALNITNHTPSAVARLSMPVTKRKSRGQGMTEYIIILGLIAIAAIAAFSFFGQTVRSQVAGMAKEVGGESGKEGITAAQAASGKALTNAQKNMNMSTYTEGGNDGAK
ncbi:MAG: pilus assembly protein [Comamonas sp.]|jgi:Flp pilus assembly pilin Flp|uniref:pilus assembly protein n=2 Tax=Comamonas sp. TaxID=34028 RepID=UPI003D151EFE